MPVVSKAQGRFLGMRHPEVLRKWKAEGMNTKQKGLPEHVKESSSFGAKHSKTYGKR